MEEMAEGWWLGVGTCSGGREPGLGHDARDKDDPPSRIMVYNLVGVAWTKRC